MTETPLRKPPLPTRPRRLGLYLPFALLLTLATAWSLGWFWLRGEVYRRMDAAATTLEGSGYRVDWADRAIYGFPFRVDLVIKNARLREQSGWSVAASRLEAEAFVFSPDSWVVVAPYGVTLNRRVGGPLVVSARVLRASVSNGDASPPRVSVEGLALAFAEPAGAKPFDLVNAAEFHLHTRAGPENQGAAYVEIDRAITKGPSLLADVADGSPVTLIGDVRFTQADALAGQGFAGALRNWSAAGGALILRRLTLQARAASVDSESGTLSARADGRLSGAMTVKLAGIPRLVGAMVARTPMAPEAAKALKAVLAARALRDTATVTIHFEAGQTTLGPVAIAPAPLLF